MSNIVPYIFAAFLMGLLVESIIGIIVMLHILVKKDPYKEDLINKAINQKDPL
jgi:hypothetical protein